MNMLWQSFEWVTNALLNLYIQKFNNTLVMKNPLYIKVWNKIDTPVVTKTWTHGKKSHILVIMHCHISKTCLINIFHIYLLLFSPLTVINANNYIKKPLYLRANSFFSTLIKKWLAEFHYHEQWVKHFIHLNFNFNQNDHLFCYVYKVK